MDEAMSILDGFRKPMPSFYYKDSTNKNMSSTGNFTIIIIMYRNAFKLLPK